MATYHYCSALDATDGLDLLMHSRSTLTAAQLIDICAFMRDCGVRVSHLCKVLGCQNYQVSHWIRVAKHLHPDVKELLHRGRITLGHCRVIAGLPAADQVETARQAIFKQLSVRDLERARNGVDMRLQASDAAYYLRLGEQIGDAIGHPVDIRPNPANKGSGAITITYANSEMFDAICHRLQVNLEDLI